MGLQPSQATKQLLHLMRPGPRGTTDEVEWSSCLGASLKPKAADEEAVISHSHGDRPGVRLAPYSI